MFILLPVAQSLLTVHVVFGQLALSPDLCDTAAKCRSPLVMNMQLPRGRGLMEGTPADFTACGCG